MAFEVARGKVTFLAKPKFGEKHRLIFDLYDGETYVGWIEIDKDGNVTIGHPG